MKKLTKLAMISASAMMLMSVGVTTANAVNELHFSQTVKADEVNGDTPKQIYTKMLNAGIATPKVKWNLNDIIRSKFIGTRKHIGVMLGITLT